MAGQELNFTDSATLKWTKGAQTGTDPVYGLPIYPLTADAPVVVGDTGSGGAAGIVPAPPAGSAAAGKFLKADGTFAVPAGSGTSATHSESLTDGNANFIFAATLSTGGDIITVIGVPN